MHRNQAVRKGTDGIGFPVGKLYFIIWLSFKVEASVLGESRDPGQTVTLCMLQSVTSK